MGTDGTASLDQYLKPIVEHKIIIGAVALVVTLLGLVAAATLPATYEATAVVLVAPISADPTDSVASNAEVDVETELRLVTSNAVIDRASASLESKSIAIAPRELADSVTASSPKDSRIIDIDFRAGTPELAQAGANAVADSYITYRGELAEESTRSTKEALSQQVAALKDELALVEAALTTAEEGSDAFITAAIEQSSLSRDLDTQQAALANLNTISSNIGRVVDPAQVPSSPSGLGAIPIVIGALVGGLVLGCLAAFALSAARAGRTGGTDEMEVRRIESSVSDRIDTRTQRTTRTETADAAVAPTQPMSVPDALLPRVSPIDESADGEHSGEKPSKSRRLRRPKAVVPEVLRGKRSSKPDDHLDGHELDISVAEDQISAVVDTEEVPAVVNGIEREDSEAFQPTFEEQALVEEDPFERAEQFDPPMAEQIPPIEQPQPPITEPAPIEQLQRPITELPPVEEPQPSMEIAHGLGASIASTPPVEVPNFTEPGIEELQSAEPAIADIQQFGQQPAGTYPAEPQQFEQQPVHTEPQQFEQQQFEQQPVHAEPQQFEPQQFEQQPEQPEPEPTPQAAHPLLLPHQQLPEHVEPAAPTIQSEPAVSQPTPALPADVPEMPPQPQFIQPQPRPEPAALQSPQPEPTPPAAPAPQPETAMFEPPQQVDAGQAPTPEHVSAEAMGELLFADEPHEPQGADQRAPGAQATMTIDDALGPDVTVPGPPEADQGQTRRTDLDDLIAHPDYANVQSTLRRLGQNGVVSTVAVGEASREASLAVGLGLAESLKHSGAQVLVVDMMIESATLHHLVGVAGEPGLTDVLARRVALRDAMNAPDELGGIRVLTTGATSADPVADLALLNQANMADLLEQAAGQVHAVVFLGGSIDQTVRHDDALAAVGGLIIGTDEPAGLPLGEQESQRLAQMSCPVLGLISINDALTSNGQPAQDDARHQSL